MNWVDLIVLGVVAVSSALGFLRGLVREVLGVAAWVGAMVGGVYVYPEARGPALRLIGNPDIAEPLAYGAAFLLLLLALSIAARVVGRATRRSTFGSLDRTAGLLFGIARGAALLVAAYILGGMVVPVERWTDGVREARTLPLIYEGAEWAVARLPAPYRPHLYAPSVGRVTSARMLLRAVPAGRALGPRPVRG